MSPFIIAGMISGIVTSAITYGVMHHYDVVRPQRWDPMHSSGIVFSCTLYLGGLLGSTIGFWFIYQFHRSVHMYAPLEGSIAGALWGSIGCVLTGGIYAGLASRR